MEGRNEHVESGSIARPPEMLYRTVRASGDVGRRSSGTPMTCFRLLILAVLGLMLLGCANPRPSVYDDPNSGRRCLEFALSGCIRYGR